MEANKVDDEFNFVEFSVSDTGIGIDPSAKHEIFNNFGQMRPSE